MNTHSWSSHIYERFAVSVVTLTLNVQIRGKNSIETLSIRIWIQICVSLGEYVLRPYIFWFAINALWITTEIEHVLSSLWCFVCFFSRQIPAENLWALQKQNKRWKKKISSKTRQSVHLNCQIKLSSALCSTLYILNFTSLLKIQIHFYFKEFVFVHCVWIIEFSFSVSQPLCTLCVYAWMCACALFCIRFCFLLCIEMVVYVCNMFVYTLKGVSWVVIVNFPIQI